MLDPILTGPCIKSRKCPFDFELLIIYKCNYWKIRDLYNNYLKNTIEIILQVVSEKVITVTYNVFNQVFDY